MSMLITILLLIAAWFLLESDLGFLALLLFLIAVINALGAGKSESHGASMPATPQQRPVIVTTSGGEFPHVVKVGLKKHWHGTDTMEDFMTNLGTLFNGVAQIGARILGVKNWKMKMNKD